MIEIQSFIHNQWCRFFSRHDGGIQLSFLPPPISDCKHQANDQKNQLLQRRECKRTPCRDAGRRHCRVEDHHRQPSWHLQSKHDDGQRPHMTLVSRNKRDKETRKRNAHLLSAWQQSEESIARNWSLRLWRPSLPQTSRHFPFDWCDLFQKKKHKCSFLQYLEQEPKPRAVSLKQNSCFRETLIFSPLQRSTSRTQTPQKTPETTLSQTRLPSHPPTQPIGLDVQFLDVVSSPSSALFESRGT
jgi:hypothetical protein